MKYSDKYEGTIDLTDPQDHGYDDDPMYQKFLAEKEEMHEDPELEKWLVEMDKKPF